MASKLNRSLILFRYSLKDSDLDKNKIIYFKAKTNLNSGVYWKKKKKLPLSYKVFMDTVIPVAKISPL